MERIVCYSLLLENPQRRPLLIRQIVASIKSLRVYNKSVPIHLFHYSELPELTRILAPYNVTVHNQGSYETRIAQNCPNGWQILSRYPLLHKLFNFKEISALAPDQVLLIDCDTLFFSDVEILFAKYSEADCYAREEHSCKRSIRSYDPNYIDEDLLVELASSERITVPPPFNSGVLLLNNQLWRRMPPASLFLSYVWRFAIWMALNPNQGSAATHDGETGIDYLREQFQEFVSEVDFLRALQFPSGNRWILDEVALWFTLGHVLDFIYGDFTIHDVLQGQEFMSREPRATDCVLCHYYRINSVEFSSWIRGCTPPIEAASSMLDLV
jgi:hypothetical protein